MDDRAVGVFDSGLGGLTAVRELRRLLPDENIIYFGDTGRMPYGGRPRAQIRLMAQQNLDFVGSFGVKAVIVACGTVSSNADDLLEANAVKTVGVLRSGAKELAATGKTRLGVIATQTSINSGAFQAEIRRLDSAAELCSVPCPEFVPLIESGHFAPDDPLVIDSVERTLAPLKDFRVEALLLGCTHYGLIADAIRAFLGEDVILVGAADAAARELCGYLRAEDLTGCSGKEIYFTSGSVADFEALAPIMLGGTLNGEVRGIEPKNTEVTE